MNRWYALALMIFLPLAALAQVPAANYVEGVNYIRLPQVVRTADPKRIEVVEVFWYGCIHCFQLEPMVNDWRKTLLADVDFHHSPAIWQVSMVNPQTGNAEDTPHAIHAQAFYAAQALGVLERIHMPFFTALNVDRRTLLTEDQLAEFFGQNGVKPEDFRKAFGSFGVQSSVKQAAARTRSYRIDGTPEMVVNGKYMISARSAGGQAEMLKVVDFLVAKERAALAAGAQ